jgi:hypothetical protein
MVSPRDSTFQFASDLNNKILGANRALEEVLKKLKRNCQKLAESIEEESFLGSPSEFEGGMDTMTREGLMTEYRAVRLRNRYLTKRNGELLAALVSMNQVISELETTIRINSMEQDNLMEAVINLQQELIDKQSHVKILEYKNDDCGNQANNKGWSVKTIHRKVFKEVKNALTKFRRRLGKINHRVHDLNHTTIKKNRDERKAISGKEIVMPRSDITQVKNDIDRQKLMTILE